MLPDIFQALKASTDVKAIVGTNPPRIYRHQAAPQRESSSPREAYVTWFLVTGTPENNLSDPPPADRCTVQVDAWHPSDAGVVLLATAVRDALELVGVVTGTVIDLRDSETLLYRMGIQADVFRDH